MKTKKDDIRYCGVSEEKIKNSSPILDDDIIKLHHNYIFERHRIYKRKELDNVPPPWTTDKIFLEYRFTNVRRELDRESKWLIKNISENKDISLEDKILNTILFRCYNKSSTSEMISQPISNLSDITEEDIEKYKSIFVDYEKSNSSYVFFTGAFNTGGLKKGNAFITPPWTRKRVTLIDSKGNETVEDYITARDICNVNDGYRILEWEKNIPTRMIRMIKRFSKSGLLSRILNASSQQEVYETLLEVDGFSKFLGYQVYVDLTYIPEFKFSENEFTVSGPGSDRGIDFLFKNKAGMSYEECIFWVRNNIISHWERLNLETDLDSLFSHLPEQGRVLNVMMLENSFCELSKYVKTYKNIGRPRKKYVPTEQIEPSLMSLF